MILSNPLYVREWFMRKLPYFEDVLSTWPCVRMNSQLLSLVFVFRKVTTASVGPIRCKKKCFIRRLWLSHMLIMMFFGLDNEASSVTILFWKYQLKAKSRKLKKKRQKPSQLAQSTSSSIQALMASEKLPHKLSRLCVAKGCMCVCVWLGDIQHFYECVCVAAADCSYTPPASLYLCRDHLSV